MATQKRHIVYMPDEDWATLKREAHDWGLSVSGLIRQKILVPASEHFADRVAKVAAAAVPDVPVYVGKPPAELVRADAFTSFRPAPKPGRK